MAIIVITDVPGADTRFAEGMRDAGVVEALQKAAGFQGHWSGSTSSGYRVIETWNSREAYQGWYNESIAPNLPPGVEVTPPEIFELHFDIEPAS